MRALLDPWLFRHPFEGASARRYARDERPAFGDLDQRLCERWRDDLGAARRLLDIGAGPGSFVTAARARFAHLELVAAEPSGAFAAALAHGPAQVVRAAAEALPLADASIDVAVSVSSIRHVGDRRAALGEARRVVRPGGALWIVELDPAADRRRVGNHARGLGSSLLRLAFGPLVVRTAPPAAAIIALARAAGWRELRRDDDPVQPVYLLRLS